jgi:hypothetical protein
MAMTTSIAALFSPTTRYLNLYVRKHPAGDRLGDGLKKSISGAGCICFSAASGCWTSFLPLP